MGWVGTAAWAVGAVSPDRSFLGLSIGLLSPHRLAGVAAARQILGIWQAMAPEFGLTHVGETEPVRHRLSPDDLSSALSDDTWMWLAARRRPVVQMQLIAGWHIHSSVHVGLPQLAPSGIMAGVRFVEGLAASVGFHLAAVHPLCRAEASEVDDRRVGWSEERRPDRLPDADNRTVGVSLPGTVALLRGLPTLYWRTYLGAPYVKLLGRSHLLNAPVASVTPFRDGLVMQLTDDVPDDESWNTYRALRDRAIEWLGRDAFWPSSNRTPDFAGFEPLPWTPPASRTGAGNAARQSE